MLWVVRETCSSKIMIMILQILPQNLIALDFEIIFGKVLLKIYSFLNKTDGGWMQLRKKTLY